ncbi:unnamed protein product [Polarella glacialis]|uniref:DDE-1 domain-containing protein n=1 Tax=Polarella glacialis TaxID=89957 RepID=A0A813ENX7_POLGL|nr:unnamed protein product [Polarella glacialis]
MWSNIVFFNGSWTKNCEKGVAPSGRLMLQEALKFIPANAPGHVRQSLLNTFGSQGRSSRKWLASFRRKWGARIGKMKIRFGMDMSEVREKATTYFRWANYVRSCVPVGERTLMINMGETALAYSWAGQKGTIVCRDRLPNGRSLRTEQASRNDMRGNVTHMAFICDDSSIQPLLPQILLGNHSKFTIRLLNSVAESSWNSHSTMRKALGILRRALQPIASTHSIILILDMARVLIHHTIYQHAKQCGTRLLYVPARLTWLLQPCDTHLFARLKNELRRRWHEERCQSESGIISSAGWPHIIAQAIRVVIQGNKWRNSFSETGAIDDQAGLSKHILGHMGLLEPFAAPSTPPPLEDVRRIFPKGLKFNVENYLLWPTTQAEETASLLNVAGASRHTAPALADSTDSPIAARTGAQARRQAGSNVVATSSSSSSSRGVATTAVVVSVRPPNRRSLRLAQRQLSNAM